MLWWILITVTAGCIVFMVMFTVRSIANILREPASIVAPAATPMEIQSEPARQPSLQVVTAAPQQQRKPHKNNITPDFEQSIRAEQERKQSYQILREQAQANPGQLGTLTETEIRKLEKEGVTGDSGYP